MITKKLANYWILIGSIPLVLFLLVAIPTVLYVKGVSGKLTDEAFLDKVRTERVWAKCTSNN